MLADVRGFFGYGREFVAWCERKAEQKGMPWVFSHAIVPVLVGCWVTPSLLGLRPFLGPREHIGVLPMYSRLTPEGAAEDVEAVAIVLESAPYDFSMGWTRGTEVEVLTSLAGNVLGRNEAKLGRNLDGIWVHMPPTGHSDHVAIVATGIMPEEIFLDERRIALADLKIVSRESAAVAMTTFGAALFGFGLVLSSLRHSNEKEGKNMRRAKKDDGGTTWRKSGRGRKRQ